MPEERIVPKIILFSTTPIENIIVLSHLRDEFFFGIPIDANHLIFVYIPVIKLQKSYKIG